MNLSLSFCSDDDVPAAAAAPDGGSGGGGIRRLGLSLGNSDAMEDDASASAPMITIGEASQSDDQSGSINAEGKFSSKKAKIDYFSRDCTAITDYLFVGGSKVASDASLLRSKGISHIVNCCGDSCDNHFPDQFHYLKLFLLDSAQEDIICVLYKGGGRNTPTAHAHTTQRHS